MGDDENPFEKFKLSIEMERLIEYQKQMARAVMPMVELQEKIVESMKPIFEMNTRIKELFEPLANIDWRALSDAAAERIKYTDGQLKEYGELLWCLDIETLAVVEEKQVGIEDLPKHIKESLPEYIEEVLGDPMFALHSSLIKETYAAYNSGYYKLCIFPLFAVFEHIINSWFDGNIQGESILITKRPQGRRYHTKINKLVDGDKGNELNAYIKVFAFSVLRVYLKTFETFGDEPNKELNRHSVAHGFHDYDSITETDVLKLFQLLKATTILSYITVEDINTQ
ncbi:hypothetical protein [Sporosarcina limicola]|uniref:Uncharacterized protein n=1 Tax=Sporosarcina limicola TaxID=34101 RepID=A0A927RG89_9BACL|nr:hypothetical protein [Sporosarcina limicola]MBE1556292.1 hypothetical protein [Sporosarcina limicola]